MAKHAPSNKSATYSWLSCHSRCKLTAMRKVCHPKTCGREGNAHAAGEIESVRAVQ